MIGSCFTLSWVPETDSSLDGSSFGTTWDMTCWGVIAAAARECFVFMSGDVTCDVLSGGVTMTSALGVPLTVLDCCLSLVFCLCGLLKNCLT